MKSHTSSQRRNMYKIVRAQGHASTSHESRRLKHDVDGHITHIDRLVDAKTLQGHNGCVNCLEWNNTGNMLASGSDDLSVILWNPFLGTPIQKLKTRHTDNIFSVKFLPEFNNLKLVSGAMDGQVCFIDANHNEVIHSWICSKSSPRCRIKRLCTHPSKPFVFWSAIEEGSIRQYDLREPHKCQWEGTTTDCKNVLIDLTTSCGNTIEAKCITISPANPNIIAVGCSDPYVRLYDVRNKGLCKMSESRSHLETTPDKSFIRSYCPQHIAAAYQRNNIIPAKYRLIGSTYVSFNSTGSELLAYMNPEHLYLYNISDPTPALNYHPETYKPQYNTHTPLANGFNEHPYLLCIPGAAHISPPKIKDGNRVDGICSNAIDIIQLKESGNQAYNDNRITEAISYYSQALSVNPYTPILYSNRAAAFITRKWMGDDYAALRDCETALQLEPSLIQCQRRRIKCLYELKWYEEAAHFLNEYLTTHEQSRDFKKLEKDITAALNEKSTNPQSTNLEHDVNRLHRENANQLNSYDYSYRFVGSGNHATDIKEANFIGHHGGFIAAGSDDGYVYIWDKSNGNLVRGFKGDSTIVNCVQWNSNLGILAVSGIENTIKLCEIGASAKNESMDTSEDKSCLYKRCDRNQDRDFDQISLFANHFNSDTLRFPPDCRAS